MNKPPSRLQDELVPLYARMICRVQKEIDPLVGLKDASELGLAVRLMQSDLFNLYTRNPHLSLYPHFTLKNKGKQTVYLELITVIAFLLGRLMYFDQNCMELSTLARTASLTCRDTSQAGYVSYIKIMIDKGSLEWLGILGDNNPHVALSKKLVEQLYDTQIGYESQFKLKQKPISRSLYSNRFKLEFPKT